MRELSVLWVCASGGELLEGGAEMAGVAVAGPGGRRAASHSCQLLARGWVYST